MKILHYLFGLPPVYIGGLVVYAMSLASVQADKADVSILIPADVAKDKENSATDIYLDNIRYNRIKKKNHIENVNIYSIKNALPVSYGWGVDRPAMYMGRTDERIYDEFLEKISPDIIHMHSVMGVHAEFMEAARKRNIPIVFTTHDFYGFCMNAKLYNHTYKSICRNISGEECRKCCIGVRPYNRIVFDQSSEYRFLQETGIYRLISKNILARTFSEYKKKCRNAALQKIDAPDSMELGKKEEYNELEKYYRHMFDMVDMFLYNSRQTEKVYSGYGYDNGENVGISDMHISDKRREKTVGKELVIGYLGAQNILKGYQQLLEAADFVYESGYRNFKIHSYGDFDPVRPYLIKHRKYSASDMENVYAGMDVLIVPSLWMETYGLVVAEAISFGTPVIVSEYVGATDILGKTILEEELWKLCEYGIIYNGQKEKLIDILIRLCESPEIINQINRRIINADNIKELQWDVHLKKIIKIYHEVIANKEKKDA